MNVLVTDASYKHALGIIRSLGSKGIQVTAVGSSPRDIALASKFTNQTAVAPSPQADAFAATILELACNARIDLIIPVGYAAHIALSRHKSELSASTKLEIPDYDKIRLAGDKKWVREVASELGIPTPRTYYPASLESVAQQPLGYPVVAKAVAESPGLTVRLVAGPHELLSSYIQLMKKDPSAPLPMLQEYVPGYGCGFFALYQRGVCKRIFMHRRIREYPPTGGASCCAQSFYDPKLMDYGVRLLDRLNWHGVAMVEFRYDTRDHDYKILEVNPKFWGSLDLALASGVDFPYYVCQMANGETIEYSEDYDRSLRFHWPFSGELQLCCVNPRSSWVVLTDCLDPRVRSNLWLSDWRPNVREAMTAIRAGWNRLRGA